MIPRQQILSFSVLAGQTADITSYTKYNHSKVKGVVLLPDKPVFGDKVYFEVNKQIVLPYGFDAGLISFRQFLNKDIKRCIYSFEEKAQGSEIRIIYENRDKRSVNIDLILCTVENDHTEITKRKKIQIVPVPYTQKPLQNGFEPCEIRTKTDFYYHELTGIFNDHFNYVRKEFDRNIAGTDTGRFIANFLKFLNEQPATTPEEKQDKKNRAQNLLDEVQNYSYLPDTVKVLFESIEKTLADYMGDAAQEPEMAAGTVYSLQQLIESFEIYTDNYQNESVFELRVDNIPVYPGNYPIGNITPRYRKTFNETMHRCNMPVTEADIFIKYTYKQGASQHIYLPRDFNTYFVYHQNIK